MLKQAILADFKYFIIRHDSLPKCLVKTRSFTKCTVPYQDNSKLYVSDSIKQLRQALLAKKADPDTPNQASSTSSKSKKKKSAKTTSQVTAESLFKKFKSEFQAVPELEFDRSSTSSFFNNAKVTLLWTVDKFENIPSEKARLENEQRVAQEAQQYEESFEVSSDILVGDLGKQENPVAVEQKSDEDKTLFHRKKDKIHPELLRNLPEVVFIGKCNVGKSSLLNSICTSLSKRESDDYAHASSKAGFTQTINCFNLGNKLRIIDTPGYGVRATKKQGEEIIKYLVNRKELRKIYLLINANHGFTDNDLQIIIGLLTEKGLAYSVIFTKVDKLRHPEIISSTIKEFEAFMKENDIHILPEYLFSSSLADKKKKTRRQGITEIRYDILKSCGMATLIRLGKNSKKE